MSADDCVITVNAGSYTIIGGIYDDRFLVKPAKSAVAMMPEADMEPPYEGAKEIQGHDKGPIPVSNGLSDRISKDLKKRGFKYVGAVTICSHLQA